MKNPMDHMKCVEKWLVVLALHMDRVRIPSATYQHAYWAMLVPYPCMRSHMLGLRVLVHAWHACVGPSTHN